MQKQLNYYHRNLRSYWRTEIVNLAIFLLVLLGTILTKLVGEPTFLGTHTSTAMTFFTVIIAGIVIIVLFGRINQQARALQGFKAFMSNEGKHLDPSLKPLYEKCRRYYHHGKKIDHINGVIALGIICGYLLTDL